MGTFDDCTNPAKPCHLHDPDNSWRIETGPWTIHSGWYVALLGLLFAVSTWPGLN